MYTINRYGINGKETVLDVFNEPMFFETEQNAKKFLKEHGYTDYEIDEVSIEIEE